MNPADAQHNTERAPTPNAPQFNAAPLGGMAANLAPNNPNSAPTMPNVAPKAPEVAPMGTPEQLSNPETQIGPGQGSAVAVPAPVLPVQQPIVVTPTTTTSDDSTTSSNPAAAADEDLIEKEWVTKAKSVIASTKDDPHAQAQQISELMRDYVKKRYGKEVGKAPDDL